MTTTTAREPLVATVHSTADNHGSNGAEEALNDESIGSSSAVRQGRDTKKTRNMNDAVCSSDFRGDRNTQARSSHRLSHTDVDPTLTRAALSLMTQLSRVHSSKATAALTVAMCCWIVGPGIGSVVIVTTKLVLRSQGEGISGVSASICPVCLSCLFVLPVCAACLVCLYMCGCLMFSHVCVCVSVRVPSGVSISFSS